MATGSDRNELYLQGGLFSVTSRILVVDLLTKNVPPEMITGLLVLHAELFVRLLPSALPRAGALTHTLSLRSDSVNQTSLEAFIVRLYRQTNHVSPLQVQVPPLTMADSFVRAFDRRASSRPSPTSQSRSRRR